MRDSNSVDASRKRAFDVTTQRINTRVSIQIGSIIPVPYMSTSFLAE